MSEPYAYALELDGKFHYAHNTKRGIEAVASDYPASRNPVIVPLKKAEITDEAVERAAKAAEKARMIGSYEWTDDQFEVWWNRDPDFVTKINVWGYFRGTRKERCIWEARIALTALT